MSDFYQLNALSLSGKNVSMSNFAGKGVLVVNTASKCGFTPQYIELEALYKKYEDRNFVILGFPCNQFGNQEPGGVEEIAETCLIKYGVSFPMFAKVDVNGANAHPVFKFLTAALPGSFGSRVKWNFTKFLLGRDGKPVRRFAPITKPSKIDPFLRPVLGT